MSERRPQWETVRGRAHFFGPDGMALCGKVFAAHRGDSAGSGVKRCSRCSSRFYARGWDRVVSELENLDARR